MVRCGLRKGASGDRFGRHRSRWELHSAWQAGGRKAGRSGRCLLGFLLLFSFIPLLFGCSGTKNAVVETPPVPEHVESILINPPEDYSAQVVREYLDGKEYGIVAEYFRPGVSRNPVTPRLLTRAVKRLGKDVAALRSPTVGELVDNYEEDIERLVRRYSRVEGVVAKAGIDREEARIGLGATAAAAVTTVGAVHLLKPQASFRRPFGLDLEVGYDVSRIDDPRILVGYDENIAFLLGKHGLGGKIRGKNAVYLANIDVKDREAWANMQMANGVVFGSRLSYDQESVKGYVQLPF